MMSVGKICTRVVHTTSPTERVSAAARRMRDHNVGTLVAVDLGGRPVGILTDRDIVMRFVADGLDIRSTLVGEVMSSPPATVTSDTPIGEALRTMAASRVRRLVVVGENQRLEGLLSLDDVLELLVEETEAIGHLLHAQTPV